MQVLNSYPKTVYWRVFKPDDTSYALGWKEGTIAPGKTLVYREDSFMEMKMEIRSGTNYGAPILTRAGQKFEMSATLVVDKAGELGPAAVTVADGLVTTQRREQVRFVDLLEADSEVTEEVSLKVENAFSSGQSMQRSHEDSKTWTVGGKVGGEIGKNDAKGEAEISAQFQSKISDNLSKSYESQVTSAWAKSTSKKLTFSPKNIHVISTNWDLMVRNATAHYFGKDVPVTIVQDTGSSALKVASYSSLAAMPQDLRKRYQEG